MISKALPLAWFAWLALAAVCLAAAFAENYFSKQSRQYGQIRRMIPIPISVVVLFLALGGLRLSLNTPQFDQKDIAYYNAQGEVIVTAWVSAPPDRRSNMVVYEMRAVEIMDPASPDWEGSTHIVKGKVQVRMPLWTDWQYGDLLQFTADLRTPSENADFSYRDYLANKNIYSVIYYPQHIQQVGSGEGSTLYRYLLSLRQHAWKTIFAIYPQSEAGLLSGILLGMDNNMPDSLVQAYRSTGTSHVIAISGFNMTIIASLLLWMLSKQLRKIHAFWITGLILVIYCLFVDGSAAVFRAALMAITAFGGHLIGRKQTGVNALGFIGAAMCVVNPNLLWDISFQLSMAATFGLVTLAQPMQEWVGGFLNRHFSEAAAAKAINPVSEYLLFTLAAQIPTLPVSALHFGQLSVSSGLANPLIIPFQPAILVVGGVSTIVGMVIPVLGKVIGMSVWPLLAYTNRVVTLLSHIKGGILKLHPSSILWVILLIAALLLVFFMRNYFKKLLGSGKLVWLMLLLICGIVSVWSIYLHQPDGKFHLRLIQSGETSTLFLQSPKGTTVLINPCGDANELSSGLSAYLSPWDYHIDKVILTDRSCDVKLAGLGVMLPLKEILLAPAVYRLAKDQYPITLPQDMQTVQLVSETQFEIDTHLSISIVAEDTQGTAISINYNGNSILIPNGVDYALIKQVAPGSLQGLTALVLTPEDISYIPPRVWLQLEPQSILWNSNTLSPFSGALLPGSALVFDSSAVLAASNE